MTEEPKLTQELIAILLDIVIVTIEKFRSTEYYDNPWETYANCAFLLYSRLKQSKTFTKNTFLTDYKLFALSQHLVAFADALVWAVILVKEYEQKIKLQENLSNKKTMNLALSIARDVEPDLARHAERIRTLITNCDPSSPLETAFITELITAHGIAPKHKIEILLDVQNQYPIDRYHVDFAFPDKKLAIELDGHTYHDNREQINQDKERDRKLQLLGWKVIRFTSSQIKNDIGACIAEVCQFLEATPPTKN